MVSNTRYGEQESACILTDPMTHLTCDLIEVAFVRNRGVGQVPSTLLTTNALPGPSIDTTTTEKGSFKLPDARSLHRYRFSNLIPLNHGARRSVIQRRRGTCAFEKTHKKKNSTRANFAVLGTATRSKERKLDERGSSRQTWSVLWRGRACR